MESQRYIVLGCKPWNRRVFDDTIRALPGSWRFLDCPTALTREFVDAFSPAFLFFLHWSWPVPAEIVQKHTCVGFHMTDVPYGRGGSPLQNLILRGRRDTMLSALRMIEELDAGPVFLQEKLSLAGRAEEILIRMTELSARMIQQIITERPVPVPQTGNPVLFRRRRPDQSRIPAVANINALYDFVRMLDADTYPAAYLEHAGYRYEFHEADLHDGRIEARVRISPVENARP